jgi:hypothetical protein
MNGWNANAGATRARQEAARRAATSAAPNHEAQVVQSAPANVQVAATNQYPYTLVQPSVPPGTQATQVTQATPAPAAQAAQPAASATNVMSRRDQLLARQQAIADELAALAPANIGNRSVYSPIFDGQKPAESNLNQVNQAVNQPITQPQFTTSAAWTPASAGRSIQQSPAPDLRAIQPRDEPFFVPNPQSAVPAVLQMQLANDHITETVLDAANGTRVIGTRTTQPFAPSQTTWTNNGPERVQAISEELAASSDEAKETEAAAEARVALDARLEDLASKSTSQALLIESLVQKTDKFDVDLKASADENVRLRRQLVDMEGMKAWVERKWEALSDDLNTSGEFFNGFVLAETVFIKEAAGADEETILEVHRDSTIRLTYPMEEDVDGSVWAGATSVTQNGQVVSGFVMLYDNTDFDDAGKARGRPLIGQFFV